MDGILHLFSLCWNRRKLYIVSLTLNQIVKIMTSLIMLLFPKMILDMVFLYSDFKKTIIYIIIFSMLFLILNCLNHLITCVSGNERMKVFNSFQTDLANAMMASKLQKIENKEFLDIRAEAELYLYGGGKGFASILEESFDIVTMFVSLLIYGWIISKLNFAMLIILCVLIIASVTLNYFYQKKYVKINLEKASQERKNAYYVNVFQDFSYGKEIKTYDLRDWLLNKYNLQLEKMIGFYKQLNKTTMIYSVLSSIILCIQQFISYWYLLNMAINQNLSVGSFTLFLSTITLFSTTIKGMISQLILVKQYTIYYKSYKRYYDDENIFREGDKYIDINELNEKGITIEFKNVSFKYPCNTQYTLNNINLTINNNDRIVVVGKNGAGKSTFIKLLLRIYKPTKGTITLNGVNINEIKYKDYLKLFSTVFQDYKLFAQSIIENITFNDNNHEKVDSILKKLGLYEKISNLDNGFNTNIYKLFDDNGYTPSEGEAQKIVFARAITKASPILILDEPSSSLDPKSEFDMYALCENIMQGKMCLFISHRLAISSLSNRILVFREGCIVEDGDHTSLMHKKGIYYEMYKMQSKYYIK